MAKYRITSPDGGTYEVTAPDDATQEQVLAYAQKNYKAPAKREGSTSQNIAGGILKGASDIGATLLTPIDAAARAMGVSNSVIGRTDRRQAVDQVMKGAGIDTDSFSYGAGKIGTQIAGTMGAGGAIANTLARVPGVSSVAGPVLEALTTGGLKAGGAIGAGGLLARLTGGGVAGGASAGLVNPSDAAMGAGVGAGLGAAASAAPVIGKAATKLLGQTTGVGDEALSQAYKAGQTGNAQFAKSMRGQVPMDDVLNTVKQNLAEMGAQKQAAYRSGMMAIKGDKTALAFDDIDKALSSAMNMGAYKGQVTNKQAAGALREISDLVEQWKALPADEFHTPEGIDALKKAIGGIYEAIPFEQKTANAAVGNVYNAVKDTINKQAPTYAKVMGDYTQATELAREIQKGLIGGKNATSESSMRKLQSLMRNNVNTAYGYRTGLAQSLEQQGGQEIMPQLAGQALQDWTPRGIQRAVAGTGGAGLAFMGSYPAAAGVAAVSSPRLMGEILYGSGKASPYANRLAEILYQSAPVGVSNR